MISPYFPDKRKRANSHDINQATEQIPEAESFGFDEVYLDNGLDHNLNMEKITSSETDNFKSQINEMMNNILSQTKSSLVLIDNKMNEINAYTPLGEKEAIKEETHSEMPSSNYSPQLHSLELKKNQMINSMTSD